MDHWSCVHIGSTGDQEGLAQVCSPAHLRQQSEDLYAVIDEVLEDPIPMRKTSPALAYPRESKEKVHQRQLTTYNHLPLLRENLQIHKKRCRGLP
ncbi:uncharacterized protein [Salmo salar]|uniref:Uncharacterized protein n=1 Tax=Salmo salar TaxID=8030 RepID=A0A1S3SYT0_SALSA|nr:uncharacterized protein LOC106612647 [Salmo salar]|eukprot:XP_014069495.1 PREDICTED: uncharacterized protein LOC106612647 isoform X2 [Salmo salar]